MTTLEARIAEVIAAHGRDGRKTWGSFVVCTCEPAWTGHSLEHPAHVAAMLAPVIAEAKADTLREAAVAVVSDDPLRRVSRGSMADWLNWRADALSEWEGS